MRRRRILAGLLLTLAAPLGAEAQPGGRIQRVGVVFSGSRGSSLALIHTFEEGLQERGYVEGRNLSIERRFTEGRVDRVPAVVAELAKLNVDVFVTTVDRWAIAVRQAEANAPIVMTMAEDPIGAGLVKSLAHPGGRITGLTIVAGPETYGKILELLKEILPKGARIAILFNADSPINARYLKTIQEAARTLEVPLIPVGVRRVEDFESAFARMKRDRAAGLVGLGEPLFGAQNRRLADLAIQSGLVSSWPTRIARAVRRSSTARGRERRRGISALSGRPTGFLSLATTIFAVCSGVGGARRPGAFARGSAAWRSSGLGSRGSLGMARAWHK